MATNELVKRLGPTEADLDALYDWFRGVYAYLDTRGVRPTTVEEIMASVDA